MNNDLVWEKRIRAAIEGDISIVYQPIVNMWASETVGYEALARFSDGTPDQYFDHARNSPLHSELERVCVRLALDEFFSIRRMNPYYVSINLCHTCLESPATTALLAGYPPNRIQVELTEHLPIEDYTELLNALKPLRAAGIALAIDDVGAGYAALRHVLNLDPTCVKLDRGLVQSVDHPAAVLQRALLLGITNFTARAGVEIVAEGIESVEELMALRTLGVNLGQGYFLGRPSRP